MSIRLQVNVNDASGLLATAAYGSGAKVRLERATSEAGSYSEIDTQTLVAGTDQYTFWDASGLDTSWYRSRISSSDLLKISDYSDPFAGAGIDAYADFDDFLERIAVPDTSRYNQLADLLVSSARYLDHRIGFDFLRHPQVSGDETRVFDVDHGNWKVPIYGGIVSATTVSIRLFTGGDLIALDASNWYLWPRQLPPEGTYTHIAILRAPSSPYWTFYPGQGTLEVDGAFGWALPPTIAAEANLAHAARSYHEWRTKQAGPVGNPDFGGVIPLTPNLPDVVYRAIDRFSKYWAADST